MYNFKVSSVYDCVAKHCGYHQFKKYSVVLENYRKWRIGEICPVNKFIRDNKKLCKLITNRNHQRFIHNSTALEDDLADLIETLKKSDLSAEERKHVINMSSGINEETNIIRNNVTGPITDTNSKLHTMKWKDFILFGKIDGFDPVRDEIIEVKNRPTKNRLVVDRYGIDDSYVVQCNLYMLMLGKERTRLIQNFRDGVTEHTIYRDDQLLESIYSSLKKFICDFEKCVSS